jgi:hypothetical protein
MRPGKKTCAIRAKSAKERGGEEGEGRGGKRRRESARARVLVVAY